MKTATYLSAECICRFLRQDFSHKIARSVWNALSTNNVWFEVERNFKENIQENIKNNIKNLI